MEQYIIGLLKVIHKSAMNYSSARYFIMVGIAFVLYYLLPKKSRWVVLLCASGYFYYLVSADWKQIVVFLFSIAVSFLVGLAIKKLSDDGKSNNIKKIILGAGIVVSAFPLIGMKISGLLPSNIWGESGFKWILPIGMSFYSLEVIAYLTDIYRGKFEPQTNPFKYALFVSFFPVIIQGPISRYEQLGEQLYEGHSFDKERMMRGVQLIIWGLFLKYLIADKASVIVNAIFNNYNSYSGLFILVAALLYSAQLYADFMSCVTISQGVAEMFGIELIDNFKRPFFSTSIKDFWRRWHVSLGEWLRDYIYIPLGGSKKGKLKKYIFLFITFAVSGLWHGGSWKYLCWGFMHATYQTVGDLIYKPKNILLDKISMPKGAKTRYAFENLVTMILLIPNWIIFRADSLKAGIKMMLSLLTTWNPWILFDNSLFSLGLSMKECEVLALALVVLFVVGLLQEKGIELRAWFNRQNFIIRWIIYLCAIWTIWIFGTYGFGFNSADFIYGGF